MPMPVTIKNGFNKQLAFKVSQYYEERVKKNWSNGHILKGKSPTASDVLFVSNDYLNLSHHPTLVNAQIHALLQRGNGLMQSSVYLNKDSLQGQAEQALAQFVGFESSLLCQSGWNANTGLIQVIASSNSPVYIDIHAHMSLWEGIKLAKARAIPFAHNNSDSLFNQLKRFGEGVIVVDSIYSTLGTISPLAKFCQLAQDFNCTLVVDESHSLGMRGAHGQGLTQELSLLEGVHFITASLAKGFCSRAGVIFGDAQAIEFLKYSNFPTIFSSGLLPHDIASITQALKLIRQADEARQRLDEKATYLRDKLLSAGLKLYNSQSQIIPLIAGTEANTIHLRDALERNGLFGSVFCWPATARDCAMIRLSINSHHSLESLNHVFNTLEEFKPTLRTLGCPMLRVNKP